MVIHCKIILYAFIHNIVNFLCQCSNFIQNFGTKSQEYYSFMENKKERKMISFLLYT